MEVSVLCEGAVPVAGRSIKIDNWSKRGLSTKFFQYSKAQDLL